MRSWQSPVANARSNARTAPVSPRTTRRVEENGRGSDLRLARRGPTKPSSCSSYESDSSLVESLARYEGAAIRRRRRGDPCFRRRCSDSYRLAPTVSSASKTARLRASYSHERGSTGSCRAALRVATRRLSSPWRDTRAPDSRSFYRRGFRSTAAPSRSSIGTPPRNPRASSVSPAMRFVTINALSIAPCVPDARRGGDAEPQARRWRTSIARRTRRAGRRRHRERRRSPTRVPTTIKRRSDEAMRLAALRSLTAGRCALAGGALDAAPPCGSRSERRGGAEPTQRPTTAPAMPRDREGDTLTPMDQSAKPNDVKLTQSIRSDVVADRLTLDARSQRQDHLASTAS